MFNIFALSSILAALLRFQLRDCYDISFGLTVVAIEVWFTSLMRVNDNA
jgi:type IV secretory pathway TrbD component